MCRLGLLPERMLPESDSNRSGRGGRTEAAQIPPEVGEALVAVFASRMVSPALARMVKEDPDAVREAMEALLAVLDAGATGEGRAA